MDEREVMTPAEVAEFVQVHIKMVHKWIESGELRSAKLGPRSTRILKADLMQFLEAKATGAAGSPKLAAEEREQSQIGIGGAEIGKARSSFDTDTESRSHAVPGGEGYRGCREPKTGRRRKGTVSGPEGYRSLAFYQDAERQEETGQ